MLLRGDECVIAVKERPVLQDLIAFEIEWCVVRGDCRVLESEVGVVDEEEAAGFQFGVEGAYLLLEFIEGEVALGDAGGVGSVFGPLKDGHAEDGIEVADRGELRGQGVEELDPWVAVLFDALLEAPAIDVDPDDGGIGDVFGEGEGFFSRGTSEREDSGRGCVVEVPLACFEELGVTVALGVGGALVVRISVEGTGYRSEEHTSELK